MRIILIRHPETTANERGLIYGKTDYEYSPRGARMLEEIEELMREDMNSQIDIYSSPSPRAHKLARAIAGAKENIIKIDEIVREMEFGIFENLTNKEAMEKFPDLYDQFMKDYSNFGIPQGESFRDVYIRADHFLKQVISRNKDCIIVSHGMFIKASIAFLLDIELEKCWHFRTNPGSIIEIEYVNNYGVLIQARNFK